LEDEDLAAVGGGAVAAVGVAEDVVEEL